jgi:hypothetical protein
VIPLTLSKYKLDVKINGNVYGIQNHPFELGFACTFYKIQGKTIEWLILELNRRNFMPHVTFSTFLVGFSRVKSAAHMRVMPWRATGKGHLLSLRAPPELKPFLSGYMDDGSWSKEKFLQYVALHPLPPKSRKSKKNLDK